MKSLQGLASCGQQFKSGSAISIGNFDGVHVGHRAILRKLTEIAGQQRLPAVLLTFEPHPIQVLFPEKSLKRLFPIQDLGTEVGKENLDALVVEKFTPELSKLSAQEFLDRHLVPALHPRHIIVGHDFSFGAGRTGTLDFLRSWCAQHKVGLTIQPAVEVGGERVSSRGIREMVGAGDMERVQRFLGRPFYMEGLVEKGAGRGQTIGVPTTNISLREFVVPRTGVYATRAIIGSQAVQSVSNLGVRPTFGDNLDVKLETHILDFHGDLYGQTVRVEFLRFLRPEKKFSGVEELKSQIAKDIESARK